jgi:hypothetical protein
MAARGIVLEAERGKVRCTRCYVCPIEVHRFSDENFTA